MPHIANRDAVLRALREELVGPCPLGQEIDCAQAIRLEDAEAAYRPYRQLGSGEEIRRMRRHIVTMKRKLFNNLTAWQTVEVSRHRERPQTLDYIDLIFDEFVELHGDRAFGDDRALRAGFARLGDIRVALIGHQKGHTLQERNECLYGCAHPEGYR